MRAGIAYQVVAVNHWPTAVATHRLNHPSASHLCAAVESVAPNHAVPGGKLDLLMAGPSCTFFSRARGGKPVNDQQRSSANDIIDWIDDLKVDTLLIENVSEFQAWGPVDKATGKPVKSRNGSYFRAWIRKVQKRGYSIDYRVLNAADYGDATTRKRLWIIARRNGGDIVWPTPTHERAASQRGLFPTRTSWRPAREIIDWSIPGTSIFDRDRPLSPKTLWRIYAGLVKFGSPELKPFLVIFRNNLDAMSVDGPIPTITAAGQHIGIAQPFLVVNNENNVAKSCGEPLATVTSGNRHYLCRPFILPHRTFANMNVDSIDDPLRTVTGVNARQFGLAQGVLIPAFGEREGQDPRAHSIDEPCPALLASRSPSFAQPFLTNYYGTGGASSIEDPVPTLTTRDRHGLVIPIINGRRLEITLRMLQPHELAAATGFDADYEFTGNQGDRVRQIGNAWPVNMADALVSSILRMQGHHALEAA